jgi:hypothetical protein
LRVQVTGYRLQVAESLPPLGLSAKTLFFFFGGAGVFDSYVFDSARIEAGCCTSCQRVA